MSRIVTVSDVHLLNLETDDAQQFVRLLKDESGKADLVVLNGDIFDFFVGRQKKALAHFSEIINLINTAASQTNVVYLQGNHDFHLDGVFSEDVTMAESWDATVGGKRYRWVHGDSLVVSRKYQILRRFLNTELVRLVTENFPSELCWKLALLWSATSRDASPHTTEADMQKVLPNVKKHFDAGIDVLITGHNHFVYDFRNPEGQEWWGLGQWMIDCWYLVTENGITDHVQYRSV